MVTERFLQRECPRCKVSDHFTELSRSAIREEELLTLGPTGPGLRRVVWHNILRAATAHEGVLAKLAARRVAGGQVAGVPEREACRACCDVAHVVLLLDGGGAPYWGAVALAPLQHSNCDTQLMCCDIALFRFWWIQALCRRLPYGRLLWHSELFSRAVAQKPKCTGIMR